MQKLLSFLVTVCIPLMLLPSLSYGQGDKELSIINDIKTQLENDDNIKEVKLVHNYYESGITKEFCVCVKFPSEKTDRWVLASPYYMYYEHGGLKCYATTDTSTRMCDSWILYNENGDVKSKSIFPDTCTIFLYARVAYDDNSNDTIATYWPHIFVNIKYKYKGDKISSVKSIREVSTPYSRKRHGLNLKYNYKKGVVNEKVYENGVLISKKNRNL